MRARLAIPLLTICVVLLLLPGVPRAFGFAEMVDGPSTYGSCTCHDVVTLGPTDPLVRLSCQHCHGYTTTRFPLGQPDPVPIDVMRGPHGYYSATTSKCDSCHTVHDAEAALLLPEPTVVEMCLSCHDGTGGFGVYGAIKAQTGRDPATDTSLGSHRVEATSTIPGGDATTGGSMTGSFSGPGGVLSCSDCHSVHGSDLVTAFLGERKRTRTYERPGYPTAKLLRRQPTGAPAPVNEYGSDWCLGCHAGRVSGGTPHNHPVESATTWPTEATRFIYRRVAGGRILAFGDTAEVPPQSSRHRGTATYWGIGNGDFLMADPRKAEQGTHKPICQQCHEDTRDVGDLNAAGNPAVVPPVLASADGLLATDNPRFQNFPHETQNDYLVIETEDDLCINCHAPSNLP